MEDKTRVASTSDQKPITRSSQLVSLRRIAAAEQGSRGLGISLSRQLIQDIDDSGGIKQFSLKSICDKKPEFYGSKGTSLRRKVQNKVAKWKALSEEKYQDVRFEYLFGVSSPEPASKPTTAVEAPRQADPSSGSSQQYSFRTPSPHRLNYFTPQKPSSSTRGKMDSGTIIMTSTSKIATYIQRVLNANQFRKLLIADVATLVRQALTIDPASARGD